MPSAADFTTQVNMHVQYNEKDAAKALDAIRHERETNQYCNLQLSKMFEEAGTPYRAAKDGAVWRLVYNSGDPNGVEEVVASTQGILCRADLPPFNEKIGATSKRVKYLWQRASITGMGNVTFNNNVLSVARIHALFKRVIGSQLEDNGANSDYKGYAALDASNRYFTPRDGTSAEDGLPLGMEVDPHGFLSKGAGSMYVHTEDNKVYYYEKAVSKEGHAFFRPASPQTFQEGDIVEIQVSFIVIPLREQKSRMSVVLRSISLLNGEFTREAFMRSITHETAPKLTLKALLKRRVGYAKEEVFNTRARLAEMQIYEDEDDTNEGENINAVD